VELGACSENPLAVIPGAARNLFCPLLLRIEFLVALLLGMTKAGLRIGTWPAGSGAVTGSESNREGKRKL